jgi:hypothetical protein
MNIQSYRPMDHALIPHSTTGWTGRPAASKNLPATRSTDTEPPRRETAQAPGPWRPDLDTRGRFVDRWV